MEKLKIQLTYCLYAILLSGLTACSNSNSKNEESTIRNTPVVALPPTQEKNTPINTEPIQSVEAEAAQQTNAEVMLNPPHGEPYHRCDIPVGAPLNSPPANTTQQTSTNQFQAKTGTGITNNPTAPTLENARQANPSQFQTPITANHGSKPRLNPPHGQPFHRCDIAVGSLLP